MQNYRDRPASNAGNIADLNGANSYHLFILKQKITGQADDDGNVEVTVPLEYLSNFWRHFEML